MSYAYNKRKKKIKHLKKQHGAHWRHEYYLFVKALRAKWDGPFIRLTDIIEEKK